MENVEIFCHENNPWESVLDQEQGTNLLLVNISVDWKYCRNIVHRRNIMFQ